MISVERETQVRLPVSSSLTTRPQIDLGNLRKFVREELIPRTAHNTETATFDLQTLRRIQDLGLINAIVPRTFGGPQLPLSDLIWIAREIGYASGGVGATLTANVLGFSAIVTHANPDLKEKLCRKMMNQPCLWSMAMTEAGPGSDLTQIQTEARPVPGGYLISGEKNFITNGNYCTDLVVHAQLKETPSSEGKITCFYVPGDAQNLIRETPYRKTAWRDSDTSRLLFKDVFVPENHKVGKDGEGLLILGKALERSKTLVAATAIGLADRALDLAIHHMSTTHRGGKLLVEQPVIRHELVRLFCALEGGWLLACKAATQWDGGQSAAVESSMAKMVCADSAFKIASECMEFQGAAGFLADNEISRILRDVKGYEIVEGPTFVQEIIISRYLLPKIQSAQKQRKIA